MDLLALGKHVLFLGLGLSALGALLILLGRGIVPHLPGDLSFKVGNLRVFFPIATSIAVSIVLTLLLNLFARK